MDTALRDEFLALWKKHFNGAELPITFYYSDGDGGAVSSLPTKGWGCLIHALGRVRAGESLAFSEKTLRCGGSKRYLGYTDEMRPGFEYFLSCGNEEMEGERYKRTPEIVLRSMELQKNIPAPARNIVFKRWDRLTGGDDPEVVIFFAAPDVLSGLFTLANFDQAEPNGVFAPFGAGCGTIIHYPALEKASDRPRAVLGMFDPSARPYVIPGTLTFAVPMVKFETMVGCMEESFLITDTWKAIRKRIGAETIPG